MLRLNRTLRNASAMLPALRTLCLGLGVVFLLSGCAYSLMSDVDDGNTKAVLTQLKEVGVNTQLSPLGTRPLILAAGHGHMDLVKALLKRGADVNAEDITGWTPLHAAAYNGHVEIAQLLLDWGAVPSTSNWYTPTPLTVAERQHHAAVVDLLKNVVLTKPAKSARN